jgi:hypothetical protein
MKKLLILGTLLMSAPFVSFAQTPATAAPTTETTIVTKPGLLPGDFFYFLDQWGEYLSLAITFNKENKARKHLEYAKERVAEMNDVLKNQNAKLDDIASAKENFDAQIADAAALVKNEKDSGADVAGLAREIDDELDLSKNELKDIFKGHQDRSSRAEEEIRAKLESLSPTDPQAQGLTQALESITKEKGNAIKEEEGLDIGLMDEQALFEEVMGKEMAAQKHMDQAMRLRDRMGQGLPTGFATSSDKFMKDAQEAMKRGDFESVKRMSKEAERALEKAREMQGDIGMPTMPRNNGTMDNDNEAAGDIVGGQFDNLERNMNDSEKMMEGLGR